MKILNIWQRSFQFVLTPARKTVAALSLALFAFTSAPSASAQAGPSCLSATPISGIGGEWIFSAQGISGFPIQTCSSGGTGGTQDSYFLWTAEEAGDYRFTIYYTNAYCHLEVYEGSSCLGAYRGCASIGLSDDSAYVEVMNVQAGDTFTLRGVSLSGFLQVMPIGFDCEADSGDPFVGNNDCTTPAIVGNGLYQNLAVTAPETDYYSVCLAAGDSLYTVASPKFFPYQLNLKFRDASVLPCDANFGPSILAQTLSHSLYYVNTSGADLDVLIAVQSQGGMLGCNQYDLLIQGANGCGGWPALATFCDPMDPNTTGQPTVLAAIPGSGIHSGIRLEASQGPPNQFGFMIIGTGVADPGLPLGQGRFCLAVDGSNQFGRYNVHNSAMNSIGISDAQGDFQNLVGTSQTGVGFDVPTLVPSINQFIRVGETWHFQLWHREANGGSNFSNGVSVTFADIP